MTEHSHHPDSHVHGLADGCPRCAEHAEHPLESLDAANVAALVDRIARGLPARSENERRAMAVVGDTAQALNVAALEVLGRVERFRADLAAQQIHVGIGLDPTLPPACVTCGTEWPCAVVSDA